VQPPVDTIVQGQTTAFTAILKDADGNILSGRSIVWSSSNTGIATTTPGGSATGVAPGTATITATSEGKIGTATLVVTPAPVASVTVAPATATIKRGDTKQFTATAKDASGNVLSGRTFTWTSSDPSIATVDQNGVVTGIAEGKNVVITATTDGKSGTAILTVSK
jgi:uncharacterized protein YjdB